MKIYCETPRLLLREMTALDAADLFEMDSDPDVHTFLGNTPKKTIEEVIENINFVRKQYEENGIGRWSVIDKETGECLGWSGLKFHTEPINNHIHFYDLGYRFKKKHWGKGYATETGKAILDYGFEIMQLDEIIGMTDDRHEASKHVLLKLGFQWIEPFDYFSEPSDWFAITRKTYNASL
jgi:ribosomal-protein-alanine N-acetyltransferase